MAVEPNVYHKVGSTDDDDDDDASACVRGEDFIVESMIDVCEGVKAMLEHWQLLAQGKALRQRS